MAKLTAIKLNKDFRTAYYHGKTMVAPELITYVRKNRYGMVRVGITTGKKIGSAVMRNRCRRIIRESFRQLAPSIHGGQDIVFVARTRTAYCKSTDILPVMQTHLQQAGLLK